MKNIICIVGESGTGKSSLERYIEAEFGIKMIESWTDREKRSPDEVGHTFISKDEFDMIKKEDMIAFTDFGDKRYCCKHSDVKDNIMTYVISEDGVEMLKNKFSNLYNIYSLRLFRDKDTRIECVGAERVGRDDGNFYLPIEYFDYVIDAGTGGLDILENMAHKIIKEIIKENK